MVDGAYILYYNKSRKPLLNKKKDKPNKPNKCNSVFNWFKKEKKTVSINEEPYIIEEDINEEPYIIEDNNINKYEDIIIEYDDIFTPLKI